MLMIGSNNAWNVTLYDNLSFDFVRDIAPVASIVRGVGVLVVHPSVSAKSVPDLIAYAKANPGKINMASGGVIWHRCQPTRRYFSQWQFWVCSPVSDTTSLLSRRVSVATIAREVTDLLLISLSVATTMPMVAAERILL